MTRAEWLAVAAVCAAAAVPCGIAAWRVMGQILRPVNRTPPDGRSPVLGDNPVDRQIDEAIDLVTGPTRAQIERFYDEYYRQNGGGK